MAEKKEVMRELGLQVGDVIAIKKNVIFWNAKSGEETSKKAGTSCIVIDVSYVNGLLNNLIIENYDLGLNITWLASLGIDEVECV